MRARTLILLFVAFVLAVGTAMLARSWLASQRSQELARAAPLAVPRPAKSVLVARADIKRGQILRAEDLIWQVWPDGSTDKNYVIRGGERTPATFAGWVATGPIGGGEPITDARVIAPGSRGFLAAVLRPGMRAISVPVTVTSGISGFIFPGDSVDLLLTYPVPTSKTGGGYEHKATETVLRDVRVVAIDQRLQTKPGEAVVAHTATFEVTPKQSEVIALASDIGKVSLTLRSLVAGKSDGKSNIEMVADTASKMDPDSPIADNATYTLDSDISPLLPKPAGAKGAPPIPVLSVCRGGSKTCDRVTAVSSKPDEAPAVKQGTPSKGS